MIPVLLYCPLSLSIIKTRGSFSIALAHIAVDFPTAFPTCVCCACTYVYVELFFSISQLPSMYVQVYLATYFSVPVSWDSSCGYITCLMPILLMLFVISSPDFLSIATLCCHCYSTLLRTLHPSVSISTLLIMVFMVLCISLPFFSLPPCWSFVSLHRFYDFFLPSGIRTDACAYRMLFVLYQLCHRLYFFCLCMIVALPSFLTLHAHVLSQLVFVVASVPSTASVSPSPRTFTTHSHLRLSLS